MKCINLEQKGNFKVILCASEQICLNVWYCYRNFKQL